MNDKTALQVLNEQQREEFLQHRLRMLDETIAKANAAAERLVRCAESISNPVYSISMEGYRGDLQIQAVRHFQGQICITVKNPFEVLDPGERARISGAKITGVLVDEHESLNTTKLIKRGGPYEDV